MSARAFTSTYASRISRLSSISALMPRRLRSAIITCGKGKHPESKRLRVDCRCLCRRGLVARPSSKML